MYAVILAGGSGTRLWPASRATHPKQFHKLISEKTIFEDTIDRISALVSDRNIYVVTTATYADMLSGVSPKMKNNIIVEPIGRNTAPAIGLAAAIIAQKDPEAIFVALPSDHYIKDSVEFCNVLKAAEKFLARNQNHIVTLGINPTFPETGYGYILLGKEFVEAESRIGENKIFEVAKFIEKPDLERAKKFVMTWGHLWNSGIFVFQAQHLLNLFKKLLPDTYKRLMRVQKAYGSKSYEAVLAEEYSKIEPISIDYGVLEKYNKVVVIPADIGWSDIGNWASLKDLLSENDENVIRGDFVGVDTKNVLVYSKKLIATIGLENVIIVETDDSILICPKDRAQDVKKITDRLREEGREGLL